MSISSSRGARYTRQSLAIGLAISVTLLASGCPFTSPPSARPAPTPRISIPPPKIQARAHPIFRLIVPKNSADEASRLMALSLRIENIHDEPLSIRPDLVRVELPDGSAPFCLDRPRAAALLKRTTLARADLFYLHGDSKPPRGGLTSAERSRFGKKAKQQLLENTRLRPGEAIEGLVVVDTQRPYTSLGNSVVEVIAHPSDPEHGDESARYPVRVILGAPIEME